MYIPLSIWTFTIALNALVSTLKVHFSLYLKLTRTKTSKNIWAKLLQIFDENRDANFDLEQKPISINHPYKFEEEEIQEKIENRKQMSRELPEKKEVLKRKRKLEQEKLDEKIITKIIM